MKKVFLTLLFMFSINLLATDIPSLDLSKDEIIDLFMTSIEKDMSKSNAFDYCSLNGFVSNEKEVSIRFNTLRGSDTRSFSFDSEHTEVNISLTADGNLRRVSFNYSPPPLTDEQKTRIGRKLPPSLQLGILSVPRWSHLFVTLDENDFIQSITYSNFKTELSCDRL